GARPPRPRGPPRRAPPPPPNADEKLEEVVVTASRIEQSTLEAPASVSVVSAEKLRETGAARPTDALTAKVPGFYFRGPTGTADRVNTGSNHSLRGQSMSRVKIMLDGVSLADGNSGQNRSLLGIEMDDIERIEVVPGASSALYGSDAIGGVVNIITKVPTKQEINVKYIRGFDEVKYDRYSASYRNRWESGLAASFSAGYEEREGSAKQNQVWSIMSSYASRNPKDVSTNTAGQTTYLIGDRGAIPSRVSRVNGKVFYNLDAKSRLYAGFGYYEVKLGYKDYHQYVSGAALTPSTLWNSSNPTYNEEFRYYAGYDGKLGKNFDLKASLSYASQDYYYVGSGTGATLHGGPGTQTGTPTKNLEGSAQLGYGAGKAHYLIFGVSSMRNELNRKAYAVSDWRHPENSHTALRDRTDADSRIDAFFVQDRIFVTDALTLYAGGRFDRWTTDGTVTNATGTLKSNASKSAFSPKLAAVWRWDDTLSFRGSIGQAFRAPTNNDLYALSVSTNRLLIPDSNVKPEKATSIDFGVEKALSGKGFVKAAVFHTRLKDMLYRKLTPYDGAYNYLGSAMSAVTHYAKMSNAGESVTKGFEFSGEMPLTSWLRASASYTWTDAKITKDESGITSLKGKVVRYVPKNMVSIGFDAKWRDWSANLMTTYLGRQYATEDNTDRIDNVFGGQSRYWLSNLRLGYRIDKNFRATLAINNLFDEKYYEYYLMPGRNVSLELRGSF
ncbi:MAG: TonB-dependent receptor, partial [Candidatus Accumulibacter sp.]|nr:TonB-dependent receptor [Accumulibacter sp.]